MKSTRNVCTYGLPMLIGLFLLLTLFPVPFATKASAKIEKTYRSQPLLVTYNEATSSRRPGLRYEDLLFLKTSESCNLFTKTPSLKQEKEFKLSQFHRFGRFLRKKTKECNSITAQAASSSSSQSFALPAEKAEKKRVLVIGSGSNLGKETFKQLTEDCSFPSFSSNSPLPFSISHEFDVFGTVHGEGSVDEEGKSVAERGGMSHSSSQKQPGHRFHGFDILNLKAVENVLKNSMPDVIIDCASSSWKKASIFSIDAEEEEEEEVEAVRDSLSLSVDGLRKPADSHPANRFLQSVEYLGTSNLVKSCKQLGLSPHMVYISAVGVGDSEDWIPQVSIDSLRMWLRMKGMAENIIKNSFDRWTILRPCPMDNDHSVVDSAILSEGPDVFGGVSRAAVAHSILQVIRSKRALNRTLAVVDEHRIVQTKPVTRPYESYESLPFKLFLM